MRLLLNLQEITVSSTRKLLVLLLLLLLAAVICVIMLRPRTEILECKETNQEEANPGRGLYRQISSEEPEMLRKMEEKMSLVLLQYDIAAYKGERLPEQKLQELELFLQEADRQKKEIIFRAAYGFDETAKNHDVREIAQIEEHVRQIAPILNAYTDSIYCVQAGFIGPWGEWHGSLLFQDKTEEEKTQLRNQVLKVLADELDERIVIDVRRPSFLKDAKKAGLDMERFGVHNDGFLASDSDLGTYEEGMRKADQKWFSSNIATGINGGEMPAVSERTEPDSAAEEFANWNISYLNAYYNTEVLEQWKGQEYKGQNAYEYLVAHLGYRFYLTQVKYPKRLAKSKAKQSIPLQAVITNSGSAPIQKGYGLSWVICQKGTITGEYEVLSDTSVILPNEEMKLLTEIKATEVMKESPLEIGLRICQGDKTVRLYDDRVYYKDGINFYLKGEWTDRGLLLEPYTKGDS